MIKILRRLPLNGGKSNNHWCMLTHHLGRSFVGPPQSMSMMISLIDWDHGCQLYFHVAGTTPSKRSVVSCNARPEQCQKACTRVVSEYALVERCVHDGSRPRREIFSKYVGSSSCEIESWCDLVHQPVPPKRFAQQLHARAHFLLQAWLGFS